ncbi:MAG: hypothetical protein FWG66_03585 [Spirochaetes bacterium]|nr:hypothetical protein [Spirochaetota bacterium]
MENAQLMRLFLSTPLVFAQEPALLPDNLENYTGTDELLFCFQLDQAQSRAFEPQRENLLASLLFAGRKSKGGDADSAENTVSMPAGTYLFVQRRQALSKAQWLDAAVEQQKDGLWERHKPEARLYVRYLFEDASPVTQLFRPVKEE